MEGGREEGRGGVTAYCCGGGYGLRLRRVSMEWKKK